MNENDDNLVIDLIQSIIQAQNKRIEQYQDQILQLRQENETLKLENIAIKRMPND